MDALNMAGPRTPLRILLVEPYGEINRNRTMIPIGLPILAAVLQKEGFVVHGTNPNYLGPDAQGLSPAKSRDHIIELVDTYGIDVVGMGGLCMSFIFQRDIFQFLRRERPHLTLISGGNMFTSEPELCMEQYGVDFGISGEGEIAATRLLHALERNQDATTIPGIFFRANHEIRCLSPFAEFVQNLDDLPLPDYELFYTQEAIRQRITLAIYASRSCPYRCTFCYHSKGNPYRKKSVSRVMHEINLFYERYQKKNILFGDELLLANKSWVNELCDELENTSFIEGWWCQTRANLADPETLARIHRAGCQHVRVGFESGSDTVLASMRKRTTARQNRDAIQHICAAGMSTDGGIIIGDFMETRETINETLQFVQESGLKVNQNVNFIVPFPGSDIYARCLAEGLITDKLAFIESLEKPAKMRVNMTCMPDDELLSLQESMSREVYRNYMEKYRGQDVAALDVQSNSSRLRVRCAQCNTPHELVFMGIDLEFFYYCPGCRYPVFVHPFDAPHIEQVTRGFREVIGQLPCSDEPDLLVTPSCLDFIRLGYLLNLPVNRVLAFLDASPSKIVNNYFGRPVRLRSKDEVQSLGARHLLIVSALHCEAIESEVAAWQLPELTTLPLVVLSQHG